MSGLRALAPIAFAVVVMGFLAMAGLLGRRSSLELIQVLDVAPRDLEVGDRMTIAGNGFPPGKTARVTFRGALHRPGEPVQRGVAIEASGSVVSPQRIEVEVGDEVESLFCQAGDRALHTTFEGDVEVAFSSAAPGGAPVGGVLEAVAIDVRPSATAFDVDREGEGERFLAFLGIRAAASRRDAGVLVREVAPGSRAESAGVAVGDVLARFDGVRVQTMGDLLPAPGESEAELGLRRAGGSGEMTRRIVVRGFRRAPPSELVGGWLAVLAALVAVVLAGAPMPAPIARAVQGAVMRARARANRAAGPRRKTLGALVRAAVAALAPSGAAAAVDLAVCACLGALAFGQVAFAAKTDVGVLFVAAATALAAAAAVAGGSARRGACAAIHVLWQHVPGAIAVASIVVGTGSLGVREIDHAQGGWPWGWLAFRGPVSLLATLLLLQGARIEPAPGRPIGAWLAAVVRAHRWVVAGLAAALFLGGWSLPGLTPAQQDARPALEAAGAVLYLAKVAAVVSTIAVCGWVSPASSHRRRTRMAAAAYLPLSMACFLWTAVCVGWGPPAAVQQLVSASLVVVSLLVAVGLGHRLVHGLTSAAAEVHLSPFL